MDVLSVRDLCKAYEGFALRDVSFALRQGEVTGFIGRNGAGKTTTLKSLLNFVHPDRGEISFFGQDFRKHEFEIKQRIGFVSGGIDYYPQKRISTITDVTRRFYSRWDEGAYRRYMGLFQLDERKTPQELSEGMKVKYSLALALSHNAELLILDEPTSGLDPVSREELLDIFLMLARDQGITIFFSTHITSDLEKCADNIVYIRGGSIAGNGKLDAFLAQYRLVRFEGEPDREARLIGCKRERSGYSALVRVDSLPLEGAQVSSATLEAVMVHMERE